VPQWSAADTAAAPASITVPGDAPQLTRLQAAERAALLRAIQELHGNMSRVAAELGVSRNTLYRKIKRHGIAPIRRA
jgi:transcriptional regulator of acetoin/glycerol metabolism